MEKNNAYVEVLAKIASLMGRTKESIQMSSSNTHTSITMFAENNSKSEILSRLDRVKISSHQASVIIHALKLECNIGRSVPAYMLMANNLNPKMDEFFSILGYDE